MSLDRRSILKVLPLAAMAGATVKIGETEAKAFEMKPSKKYVFVMAGISAKEAEQCVGVLRGRGIDATICATDADLKIYELE